MGTPLALWTIFTWHLLQMLLQKVLRTQKPITSTHDSHPTGHPHPHPALHFFFPPYIHDSTVPLPSFSSNPLIKLCPVESAIPLIKFCPPSTSENLPYKYLPSLRPGSLLKTLPQRGRGQSPFAPLPV